MRVTMSFKQTPELYHYLLMHSAKRQRRIDMAFPYIFVFKTSIQKANRNMKSIQHNTIQYNTIQSKLK